MDFKGRAPGRCLEQGLSEERGARWPWNERTFPEERADLEALAKQNMLRWCGQRGG